MVGLSSFIGHALAAYIGKPRHIHGVAMPTPPERLRACLMPGDVLLVEGSARVSVAIKYLTQSTWSHAALYVGPGGDGRLSDVDHCFVEADLVEGVRSVGLSQFDGYPTRICRPVHLRADERRAVVDFVIQRLGHRYDLKNVFDLARYLIATPPAPTHWRRRLISFGSGDPTRAICSTLIAEAFQSIGYPILPTRETRPAPSEDCPGCVDEILLVRHHTLFAPRDFDVSPYFQIVKPTIEGGFDFHDVAWSQRPAPSQKAETSGNDEGRASLYDRPRAEAAGRAVGNV